MSHYRNLDDIAFYNQSYQNQFIEYSGYTKILLLGRNTQYDDIRIFSRHFIHEIIFSNKAKKQNLMQLNRFVYVIPKSRAISQFDESHE